jgi:hypothetical protein
MLGFQPERVELNLEVRQKVQIRFARSRQASQPLANLLNPPTPFVNFIKKPLNRRKIRRCLSGHKCHYSGFERLAKLKLPLERFRADDRSALFDGVSCIGFEVVEGVALAAGPGDFHAVSLNGFPQAKR